MIPRFCRSADTCRHFPVKDTPDGPANTLRDPQIPEVLQHAERRTGQVRVPVNRSDVLANLASGDLSRMSAERFPSPVDAPDPVENFLRILRVRVGAHEPESGLSV